MSTYIPQGTLHCPLYKISTINSFKVPMSTYITQVISLEPCIAPFISMSFKVSKSTYISLGPCTVLYIAMYIGFQMDPA